LDWIVPHAIGLHQSEVNGGTIQLIENSFYSKSYLGAPKIVRSFCAGPSDTQALILDDASMLDDTHALLVGESDFEDTQGLFLILETLQVKVVVQKMMPAIFCGKCRQTRHHIFEECSQTFNGTSGIGSPICLHDAFSTPDYSNILILNGFLCFTVFFHLSSSFNVEFFI